MLLVVIEILSVFPQETKPKHIIVYYMLKDIDNFKIKLNYLNQSAAKLDNTTLNMLRFWQKGDI